jgi:hypothetical protein
LLKVGTLPPQVAGSDHRPLCADWITACTLSDEKSGMFSGSTTGGGGGGTGVPDTVTVVDALALPPEPEQVRE